MILKQILDLIKIKYLKFIKNYKVKDILKKNLKFNLKKFILLY